MNFVGKEIAWSKSWEVVNNEVTAGQEEGLPAPSPVLVWRGGEGRRIMEK